MRQASTHPDAFIAIGSNLGDSRATVMEAIVRLQSLSDLPIKPSSLWDTTPVDCPPGSARFVNAVVGMKPCADETPESLLDKLQEIERAFGRQPKKVANEPRPLDLDLLAFDEETRDAPELILPHPRAHLRRFVLQPLSEIAPELILPGQKKSISVLLRELSSDEVVRRIP